MHGLGCVLQLPLVTALENRFLTYRRSKWQNTGKNVLGNSGNGQRQMLVASKACQW